MEQKVLAEFLKLYRDQPILWDTSHKLYSNKLARNRALDVLYEKYKEFDHFADKQKMKKKIENVRTTYRRERSKVRKAKMNGELYEPTLWYYSLMTFLEKDNDKNQNETTESESEQYIVAIHEDEDANDDDDDEGFRMESTAESPTPPVKRKKPASVYLNENNDYVIESVKKYTPAKKVKRAKSVYLEENDNMFQEEPSCSIKNEPSEMYLGLSTNESDSYSKTISAQLNELKPMQRFIAEKLISDVIFFGRLEKLKTGTSLDLNSDID